MATSRSSSASRSAAYCLRSSSSCRCSVAAFSSAFHSCGDAATKIGGQTNAGIDVAKLVRKQELIYVQQRLQRQAKASRRSPPPDWTCGRDAMSSC